jgi:hypothetical protein
MAVGGWSCCTVGLREKAEKSRKRAQANKRLSHSPAAQAGLKPPPPRVPPPPPPPPPARWPTPRPARAMLRLQTIWVGESAPSPILLWPLHALFRWAGRSKTPLKARRQTHSSRRVRGWGGKVRGSKCNPRCWEVMLRARGTACRGRASQGRDDHEREVFEPGSSRGRGRARARARTARGRAWPGAGYHRAPGDCSAPPHAAL